MRKFDFTHTRSVSSSAVDSVHYNSNTQELAVNLHGEVYVYPRVPLNEYESLVNAGSVGKSYRVVKDAFGPSSYLGRSTQISFNRTAVDAPAMVPVAPASGLRVTERTKITTSTGPHVSLGVAGKNLNAPKPDKFDHAVKFTVNGGNEVKTHNVSVSSVNEAVDALSEIAAMLGVNVTVKEVTVYFD